MLTHFPPYSFARVSASEPAARRLPALGGLLRVSGPSFVGRQAQLHADGHRLHDSVSLCRAPLEDSR